MTKFFSYAAILIGLSATATLAVSPRTEKPTTTGEALFAADGAFRDGLYLGQLVSSTRPAAASRHWPLVHRARPLPVRGRISPGYERSSRQRCERALNAALAG